jgi:N-acetylmuramoyl-L-alanine amidase
MHLIDKTKPGKVIICFKKPGLFLMLMVFIFMVHTRTAFTLEHQTPADVKKVIVLDPGHGGDDIGARGPDGGLEKDAALTLARIIAKKLKPAYEVVFTRNGDYQVDLTKRTSVANHKKADLFISIHTGGSSRYQTNHWAVYYYAATNQTADGYGQPAASLYATGDSRQLWDTVQARHQADSKFFAHCIKNKLKNIPGIPGIDVSKMPLRILEGADMPAIIFEAGYLTNPKAERQLKNKAFLTDVAVHVRKGIEIYFNSKK